MNGAGRPNLLIIMSDQHAFWASGAYGHPFIQTPHLDRLAQRGVSFESAYCNSPLCGPSRMSFLSGRLPFRIGAWTNGVPMASDIPTWAHYLSKADYQTVLAGKQHFVGPDQSHGFEMRLGGEIHSTRIRPYSYASSGARPDMLRYFQAGPGRTQYIDYDDAVTEHACSFLAGKDRDRSRPFALCVSLFSPHFPLIVPVEYWQQYWPEHGDLPNVPDGYLDRLHTAWKAHREFYQLDALHPEQERKARAAYYALCTYMDAKVGQILSALTDNGLDQNTAVVYMSDHGEHAGSHGLWWKKTFFEESVRVPLIVSWPGQFPQGERRRQVVSLIDVAATLVDIAGEPGTYNMDGHSLAEIIRDGSQPWHDLAVSEFVGVDELYIVPDQPICGNPRRMLRQGRFKLNMFVGAPPELYDLEEDPGEWHNLAGAPAYRAVVESMTSELTAGYDPNRILAQMWDCCRRCEVIMDAESAYLGQVPKAMEVRQTGALADGQGGKV